jgi:hypothetical protein
MTVSKGSMLRPITKALSVLSVLAAIGIIAGVARGGHEMPVYPSYYPHEIVIETMPPESAAALLPENKIQAYVGPEPRFSGDVPASIRAVESLGNLVIVRVNAAPPSAKDNAPACATVETIVRDMAGKKGFVFHPYPVTPFHGDYLFYADLAEAAKSRFLRTPAETSAQQRAALRIKAGGALKNLVRPEWIAQGSEWDAAIEEVSAEDLVASSMTSVNGWLGPPWVKTGWFHAERILADAIDDAETRRGADAVLERLEKSDYRDAVERVNLERELVTALTSSCHKVVVGYTVKRQVFSAEFTDGIENIGFDSFEGLNSPMFLRTVKLKDFPWNGWLTLGIDSSPDAAWNPIAGFTDPFGRLLWSAVGDPALLYAPYDSRWMVNRISDVQSSAAR